MSTPPPVPALPDTERRTQYSVSGSTGPLNVNFAIYGDDGDPGNWLQVYVNGALVSPSNWTLTSPSGTLSTLARPITDAVITFALAQTGTVQIVGARRPRRASQFTENRGVAARDLNQVVTDIIAQGREVWDSLSRVIRGVPGDNFPVLPAASVRANTLLGFDISGALTTMPLGPTISVTAGATFNTRALAAAATISGTVQFVQTAGLAAVGDLGAALYKKAGGSTTGGFQSADGQWWQIAQPMAGAVFSTRALAAAAIISSTAIAFIRTEGYAAIGDYGAALYKQAGGSTTGGFQSADGQWWQIAEVSIVRPEMFGAKGDNANDDTTAVQNAINVAQAAPKGIVDFRAALYKCTSTLAITAGVYLRGVGYSSIYKTALGSQLYFYGVTVGMSVVCDDSVFIEKLGFFPVTNASNMSLLTFDTDNSTAPKANLSTVIRDCMFQGAAFGINAPNFGQYIVDNCQFWNCTNISMQTDALNSVGGGDCILSNSTFSGNPTNGHFRTGTLGGMRIVNNKFNASALIGAIGFVGTVVSAQAMSPIIIANNSIEGCNVGITFVRTGSATVGAANLSITGNEIACSGNNARGIICTQSGGNTNQWVSAGVISGNLFTINNGTGLIGVALDAAADITVIANQFYTNAGGCVAINVGANTARITALAGSNGKGLNVT